MSGLSKSDILKRGWTDESFKYFAGRNHSLDNHGEQVWEITFIEKVEKTLDFQGFTTIAEFRKRNEYIRKFIQRTKDAGIKQINALNIEFEKHDCLTKNKHNYDPLKPIFHLVKKDFTPDKHGDYSLFTDGSFKYIGSKAFSCCAGWIVDNKTKEIVIEFTKTVDLNPKQVKGKGIPDFELMGIAEGVKIISQLGIKNVHCYSDSLNEVQLILSAMNKMGNKKYSASKEVYDSIIDVLKKSNSIIGWIPREYNKHADELTKIPLNAWEENYKKVYLEQDYIEPNGYVVDRSKQIYFHHPKLECPTAEEVKSPFTLICWKIDSEKAIVTVLHNKEDNSVSIIDKVYDNDHHIDKTLPKDVQISKKSRADSKVLTELCNSIKLIPNIEKLNICVSPGVISVCKKAKAIPPTLQEEFFELHKLCNDFSGQLALTEIDKELNKRLINFFHEEYPLLLEKGHKKRSKIKI